MRFCISALVALITIVGFGCQTVMHSSSPAMTPGGPQRAVVVSGGNGGATTVFLPSADPEKPMMLCTSGDEVCPECKAAAIKYFQTGVLEPTCSRTGRTRTLLIPATPNVGHQ